MVKNVLVLLIDALGYNFVSKTRTPYLWNFANRNSTHAITPVLGYSDSQRAAIFTGKQPQEIGYWLDSQLVGIGESPYKAWKYFQTTWKYFQAFPESWKYFQVTDVQVGFPIPSRCNGVERDNPAQPHT